MEGQKRIAVLQRWGRKIAEDVKICLLQLHQAAIPAHRGIQELGLGVIWIERALDLERALGILRATGCEVTEHPLD